MVVDTTPKIIPELYRVSDVCKSLGLARSTIYALLAADASFPAPIRVTRRAIRWRRIDIEEWARSRPVAKRPVRPGDRAAA